MDAYDVSSDSIQTAQKLGADAGYDNIHYAVGDMNTMTLPKAAYDGVWIAMALHHVADVTKCLQPSSLATDPQR